MIKNIFIHFLASVIISFLAAWLLDHYTYCESMCIVYYATSAFYLLPLFFILGLPVPIGLKKYPKEIPEFLLKRRLSFIFGLIGMAFILSFYLISSYETATSKNITSQSSNATMCLDALPRAAV